MSFAFRCILPLASLVLCAALLVGCAESAAPPPPVAEVVVARPAALEVVEWDEYTGRLEATDTVEIRARVSGYLESIHFDEGAMVEEGDLLFVIDPRPFEAALGAAQAELDQARSGLALAKNDRERADRLIQSRAISEEEFDRRVTGLRSAQAAVRAARSAVREAELELEFTRVRAPLAGRVGRHLITEGNLINGGSAQSSLLTTIVSLDPIHCYFEVDERAHLKYVRLGQSGSRPTSRANPNPVFLALADEDGFPHRGAMDFVDNTLDPTTGTMAGRAIFANPDRLLTPGQFGRLRLLGSGRYDAILLPDAAIATDQSEQYVMVVDAEGNAVRREVTTGARVRGLRVIEKGVTAGDRVVVAGLQRIRPGASLEVVEQEIEPEPELIALELLFGRDSEGADVAAPADES